jgi:hypothetical protein
MRKDQFERDEDEEKDTTGGDYRKTRFVYWICGVLVLLHIRIPLVHYIIVHTSGM